MKIVPIQDLVVGDVFAKEIKLKGRQAIEVVERPASKSYLIVRKRGEVRDSRYSMKDGMKVHWLRNVNS